MPSAEDIQQHIESTRNVNEEGSGKKRQAEQDPEGMPHTKKLRTEENDNKEDDNPSTSNDTEIDFERDLKPFLQEEQQQQIPEEEHNLPVKDEKETKERENSPEKS